MLMLITSLMYSPLDKLRVDFQKKVFVNDMSPGYVVSVRFLSLPCQLEQPITDLKQDIQQHRKVLTNELCFIFANCCSLIGKILLVWNNKF